MAAPHAMNTLLSILEKVRQRYKFSITDYAIMPEHVHLLLSEPEVGTLSLAMQVLKQNSARNLKPACAEPEQPFWQTRFYDFNVWAEKKRVEKLRYMHRNPVTRSLVASPEQWEWSSFRYYSSGEPGPVEIDSR
jgi:putative transposase